MNQLIELPKPNEVFSLTLNNPGEAQGYLQSVADRGGTEYKVSPISRKSSGNFMLVPLQMSGSSLVEFEEIRQSLTRYGSNPSGQWLVAFRETYQAVEDVGFVVAVADGNWIGENGEKVCYPFLRYDDREIEDDGWIIHLRNVSLGSGRRWLWLVQVS